ncbi:MAG: methylenetetrahydrofolate--tRNA-(uracil(54)-C(5))-methyltransferase (FADH(2)-oxidizing) TrmFO [Bacillota bacterium]
MDRTVNVIGAGLAGSEAAWQIAARGIKVSLYEMRPEKTTPAHRTGWCAEIVCSNSFGASSLENASGLLKEEMRMLHSLVVAAADRCKVPAGGALAVDREQFSREITAKLEEQPQITIFRQEIKEIPPGPTIIATGPLTSPALAEALQKSTGEKSFYFYDAAAPVVACDSLDMDKIFPASRYGKGEGAYLNCPFTRQEYERFWEELVNAEKAVLHPFEKAVFFEDCLPVEELASRGRDSLRFGPMKPVGLIDPRTGKGAYAVVQLRRDNIAGTLYNMVGFQTRLKWGEQQRVFRMIPGMENARFVRLGVMHRNSYINSPRLLEPTLQWKADKEIFFAGQITGVEGYMESAAAGLVAGINAARLARGLRAVVFPKTTAHGALIHYICFAEEKFFQPMHVNFGLFPPVKVPGRRQRAARHAEMALKDLQEFINEGNC